MRSAAWLTSVLLPWRAGDQAADRFHFRGAADDERCAHVRLGRLGREMVAADKWQLLARPAASATTRVDMEASQPASPESIHVRAARSLGGHRRAQGRGRYLGPCDLGGRASRIQQLGCR